MAYKTARKDWGDRASVVYKDGNCVAIIYRHAAGFNVAVQQAGISIDALAFYNTLASAKQAFNTAMGCELVYKDSKSKRITG